MRKDVKRMERLTFEGNFCDIAQCQNVPGGSFCENGSCSQKQVWERLKEYEDTGISPKACLQAVEMEDLLADEYYSMNRMLELMKADKEGRVVVLPCKVGDTVWRISYRLNGKHEIEQKYFSLTYFDVDDFGKNFFMTREEAEKALEARNGDQ